MQTPPPEVLALSGTPAPITWRRCRRARRITLRIDAQAGGVVVTLPMRTAASAGRALLARNADWVADRLAALPSSVPLAPGATIDIAGAPCVIVHRPGAVGGAWLEPGALCVSGAAEFIGRRVRDFLRAEARRRLSDLAQAKMAEAGLAASRITVRDTRSRWGSCAPDRTLMFCWRLVMAPPFVQDYVVAHEVAHLRHMNHGADFWRLAEALSPHRAAATAWLVQNGPGLLRVG